MLKLLMDNDYSSYSNNDKGIDKEDYYTSEEGYIIFTEKYHLKRGYCCKNNCKHCPYGFDIKTGEIKSKN
jgi:hypothetical protein